MTTPDLAADPPYAPVPGRPAAPPLAPSTRPSGTLILRYAYAAAAAYDAPAAMTAAFNALGFTVLGAPFAGAKETVAVAVYDATVRLIVVRGTVTARNWRSNLEVNTRRCAAPGMPEAQAGWLGEADVLTPWAKDLPWPAAAGLPLDVCGHSAGAAAVTDLAITWQQWTSTKPRQVVTFGSPRPGLAHFRSVYRAMNIPTIRVVHEEDIVPTVPPAWLGYRHVCPPLHLDPGGVPVGKLARGWRSLWRAWWNRFKADIDGQAVREHFMSQEIPDIEAYARANP
jgi:hypothetical protein